MLLGMYCLPGKVIAQLKYLWPSPGQVQASGRRKDSRLVHFVYATVFWGAIAWVLLSPATPNRRSAVDTASSGTRNDRSSSAMVSTPPRAIAPDPVGRNGEASDGEPVLSAADVDVPSDARGGVEVLEVAAVQTAIDAAAISGSTERWSDRGSSGHVVPSETVVAGCRKVLVFTDGEQGVAETRVCS